MSDNRILPKNFWTEHQYNVGMNDGKEIKCYGHRITDKQWDQWDQPGDAFITPGAGKQADRADGCHIEWMRDQSQQSNQNQNEIVHTGRPQRPNRPRSPP